jgi:hypothetical protein
MDQLKSNDKNQLLTTIFRDCTTKGTKLIIGEELGKFRKLRLIKNKNATNTNIWGFFLISYNPKYPLNRV